MAERRTPVWIAFAAGAVAMLVIVLVWWAWRTASDAGSVAGEIVEDVEVAPDIEPPRIPPTPPIPDSPLPAPR